MALVMLGVQPPRPCQPWTPYPPFSGWSFGNYGLPTHPMKSLRLSRNISLRMPELHKGLKTSVYWWNSCQDNVQHVLGTQRNICLVNKLMLKAKQHIWPWINGADSLTKMTTTVQVIQRMISMYQVCLGISVFILRIIYEPCWATVCHTNEICCKKKKNP